MPFFLKVFVFGHIGRDRPPAIPPHPHHAIHRSGTIDHHGICTNPQHSSLRHSFVASAISLAPSEILHSFLAPSDKLSASSCNIWKTFCFLTTSEKTLYFLLTSDKPSTSYNILSFLAISDKPSSSSFNIWQVFRFLITSHQLSLSASDKPSDFLQYYTQLSLAASDIPSSLSFNA